MGRAARGWGTRRRRTTTGSTVRVGGRQGWGVGAGLAPEPRAGGTLGGTAEWGAGSWRGRDKAECEHGPAWVHRASCLRGGREGSLTPRPSLARRLMGLMANEGGWVDLLFMGRWRRGHGGRRARVEPPEWVFWGATSPKNAGSPPGMWWGRSVGVQLPGYPETDGCGAALGTPKPMCVVRGCSKLPKSDVCSTGLLLAPQNRCVPCVGLLQAPQKCLKSDVSLVAGTPDPPQTDVSLSGTAPGTPKLTCPGTGQLLAPQNCLEADVSQLRAAPTPKLASLAEFPP